MTPNLQKIETLVRQLLVELGEDPGREGLRPASTALAQPSLVKTSALSSS